jgi:hypothetical protein
MPSRARTNRKAFFGEPETRGVAMTETLGFTALDQFLGIKRLAADTAPASPLGSLVARPSVRSRNSVAFLSLRSWRRGPRRFLRPSVWSAGAARNQHVAGFQIGNKANERYTVRTATEPNNRHSHEDKT